MVALPNLVYTSDDQPGYTRKRWGRGFSYRDSNNNVLSPEERGRILKLVIPPAWQRVWICRFPNGHLQCTGRDPGGRKQYIYHPEWTAYRQASKFLKMRAFARKLPAIRQQLDRDLHRQNWDKQRVLALAVAVLDRVHLRVGNRQYARKNQTYGLTTLRRRHLDFTDGELHLNYKAKSNKYRDVAVDDAELSQLIRECAELPGYEIFRYRNGSGGYETIDSQDVNGYIRELAEEEAFSAKDFRTWAGTQTAIELYNEARQIATEKSRDLEPTLVKMVAQTLGNTPAVCREYYIHPHVLEAVRQEAVPPLDSVSKKRFGEYDHQLDAAEIIALDLISAPAQTLESNN